MYRDTRKRGEKVEKSRAEYFRQRREDKKNFSVYVDKDKAEKLENKLKAQNLTKAEWLNDIIEEELTMNTIREIACPYCGHENSIEISDVSYISSSERGMGPETLYEIDEQLEFECEKCGEVFTLKGYISEYPIGCLNHEDIEALRREE